MKHETERAAARCMTAPHADTGSTAAALLAAAFAAQSASFVLPPMLPVLAERFDVTVAEVGQLRAVSGLAAAVTPVLVAGPARRWSLRTLMAGGLALGTGGSLLTAFAWAFEVLVAAHVLLGAGLAVVLSAALAASADWAPPGGSSRLLSWTMMGPPAAAVVATPAAGALVALDWRLAWLLPVALSVVAGAALVSCPAVTPAAPPPLGRERPWRIPGVAGWWVGELLAYTGWSMVVVYGAALLIESYGVGALPAAGMVSLSAVAFMVGNRLARGLLDRSRPLLLTLALALAVSAGAFGLLRAGFAASTALLGLLGLLNGGRSPTAVALGLRLAPGRRAELMGTRTSAQSLGYLAGAALGGLVLTRLGYGGLGVLMAVMFGCAALPHLAALRLKTIAARTSPPSRPHGRRRPPQESAHRLQTNHGQGAPAPKGERS